MKILSLKSAIAAGYDVVKHGSNSYLPVALPERYVSDNREILDSALSRQFDGAGDDGGFTLVVSVSALDDRKFIFVGKHDRDEGINGNWEAFGAFKL